MSRWTEDLKAYAERLSEEMDSPAPRVYPQVAWSYQDTRVREAIGSRLESGQVLISSKKIVADRALRRERVYFDFAEAGRLDARVPGILVQLQDDNSVVEILDPFDLVLNAAVLAPTSSTDTLAYYAAYNNAALTAPVDEAARADQSRRWSEFVAQPMLLHIGGLGGLGGFGGGLFDSSTTLTGGTWTPGSTAAMSEVGDKEDPDSDLQGGEFDDPQ